MTDQTETLAKIRAELEVIEVKLNDLLKKFGGDEEDLWDLHRHVYDATFERLKNESSTSDAIPDQGELF